VDYSKDFFSGMFRKDISKEEVEKYFSFYGIKKEADKKKTIQDLRARGHRVNYSETKKENQYRDLGWLESIQRQQNG
jgi:hypothetical protein